LFGFIIWKIQIGYQFNIVSVIQKMMRLFMTGTVLLNTMFQNVPYLMLIIGKFFKY